MKWLTSAFLCHFASCQFLASLCSSAAALHYFAHFWHSLGFASIFFFLVCGSASRVLQPHNLQLWNIYMGNSAGYIISSSTLNTASRDNLSFFVWHCLIFKMTFYCRKHICAYYTVIWSRRIIDTDLNDGKIQRNILSENWKKKTCKEKESKHATIALLRMWWWVLKEPQTVATVSGKFIQLYVYNSVSLLIVFSHNTQEYTEYNPQ